MSIIPQKPRVRINGYVLPDVLQSFEEYRRFHNLDLGEQDAFSLEQELYKSKQALAHIDLRQSSWLFVEQGKFIPALDWLKNRHMAVRSELGRRGRASA